MRVPGRRRTEMSMGGQRDRLEQRTSASAADSVSFQRSSVTLGADRDRDAEDQSGATSSAVTAWPPGVWPAGRSSGCPGHPRHDRSSLRSDREHVPEDPRREPGDRDYDEDLQRVGAAGDQPGKTSDDRDRAEPGGDPPEDLAHTWLRSRIQVAGRDDSAADAEDQYHGGCGPRAGDQQQARSSQIHGVREDDHYDGAGRDRVPPGQSHRSTSFDLR
jgi:hypothetical protein